MTVHEEQEAAPVWGRWFGLWSFLLVWPRALLLQVAHPAVSAGVEQHSAYREDPWKRAYRTLDQLQRLIYADPADGAALGRTLRYGHRDMHGTDRHGLRYHALQPELFLWVHATYLDSLITLTELSGTPLTSRERDQLYTEWRTTGRHLGLREQHLPPDFDAFTAYYATMLPILEATPCVEELLGPATLTPPAFVGRSRVGTVCWRTLGRLLFPHLIRVTVALLPSPAATAMGLAAVHPVYRLTARAAALFLNALPYRLRCMPCAAQTVSNHRAGAHTLPANAAVPRTRRTRRADIPTITDRKHP
ncbi:oxygenase MpaB family protein [Streptomyces sp. NPDC015346]|uniref:oxygenase MpaB family protein n=1 Tax=Streptomyces sp. NPDC015346 TaxID=3364954 RepID=UPI0037017A62